MSESVKYIPPTPLVDKIKRHPVVRVLFHIAHALNRLAEANTTIWGVAFRNIPDKKIQ